MCPQNRFRIYTVQHIKQNGSMKEKERTKNYLLEAKRRKKERS